MCITLLIVINIRKKFFISVQKNGCISMISIFLYKTIFFFLSYKKRSEQRQ
jgi:hypothetical protein